MCAIARGATGEPIARNDVAVCVLDRLASRRGHLLVIAERHVEALGDLGWRDYVAMQRLAWEASRALEAVFRPVRLYVAMLGSREETAKSFPHLHLHVVPLDDGGHDDRPAKVFTWDRVHVYDDDEASAIIASLRAVWRRAEGSDPSPPV